jgi:hypothetical protein
MAIDVTGGVSNLQVIEVGVTGPGRARRLFLISGQMPVQLGFGANAGQTQSQRQVVVAKVGPDLTAEQFVRAEASAAMSAWQIFGDPNNVTMSVDDVDADYDDESGRVAIEVEVSATAGAGAASSTSLQFLRVSFTAQIVATE